jgi:flagellar L-ring protein precursor FlgH
MTTARVLAAVLGVALASTPAVAAGQSLYREGAPGANLFADNRARGVNDIVTVLISEQSTTSRAASTKSAQDTSRTASVTQFPTIFDPIAKRYITPITKQITGNSQSPSELAEQRFNLNMATSGSHQGSANIDREDKVTGQIAARVVRVLDNGNLLIEGRRSVLVNNDTQIITLSGIIRPQDVTSANTILSGQIADAEIQVEGQGLTSEAQNPGLFYRILDWLGVF